jgi:hypothetical protein
MKATLVAAVMLLLSTGCFAQTSLFPRHVVTPQYSQIARMVHVSGEVVLLVTIAGDGTVIDAKRVSGPPLFELPAIENVRT